MKNVRTELGTVTVLMRQFWGKELAFVKGGRNKHDMKTSRH